MRLVKLLIARTRRHLDWYTVPTVKSPSLLSVANFSQLHHHETKELGKSLIIIKEMHLLIHISYFSVNSYETDIAANRFNIS